MENPRQLGVTTSISVISNRPRSRQPHLNQVSFCRQLIVLLLLLVAVSTATAQEVRSAFDCTTRHKKTKAERIELSKQFLAWKQQRLADSVEREVRYVPVVFHVLSAGSPTLSEYQSAVATLNNIFSNEGSFETEAGIDTKIRFCLAQTTPDGGRTTGVNHVPSEYTNHDVDLETSEVYRRTHWDTESYLNIYVVDQVDGESSATYEGRTWWERAGVGGYATSWGIAVTSLSGELLAHECGHYFGLLHTFEGQDCRNDDCLVDGDMVCDTPPDQTLSAPCGGNSCQTDTLSNFSNGYFLEDTLDMSTNIMDYTPCPEDFTFGQAERMHFTLDESFPNLASTGTEAEVCEAPCTDDILVSFEIGNEYPVPGENTQFSSTVTSEDSVFDFRWYVHNEAVEMWTGVDTTDLVATTEDLSYAFPTEGVYRVTLHVRNSSTDDCYASFAANVIVTCGVDARFYPDKRLIASKQPHALLTDSVTFTNRSHDGISFEWSVTHENFDSENPSLEEDTSTAEDLTYYFREPGNYEITLTASDGSCTDESNTFTLEVIDPTIDGSPQITEVECGGEQLSVAFRISNFGYDTINVGTPVAFYDADPTSSAEADLLGVVELPRIVYGFEQENFTTSLPTRAVTLSEIFIVFNDTGTVDLPLVFPPGDQNRLSTQTEFPPSGYSELTYSNNVSSFSIEVNREFDLGVCEGDEFVLDSEEIFGPIWCWDSLSWESEIHGLLGTSNSVEYVATEDDLIEVTFFHDSLESTGRIEVMITNPLEEVSVPDTVYRIVEGGSTRLVVSQEEGYTYEWSPVDGLDDPSSSSPTASPEENTLYTVEITDENGCVAEVSIQVWVETTAYIPNLFTPNDDGANDRLLVYDLVEVSELSFRIFNRQGGQVFAADDEVRLTSSGWDGNSGGTAQPAGTYFWEIQGTYEDGRPVTLNGENSGVIHLIR